jgi:hypothetical protein
VSAAVLEPAEVDRTARFIAGLQRSDGEIPWEAGAHTDPWDHVEAAMALDVAGHHASAVAAYEWLAARQNPDGSWYRGYQRGTVSDPVRESNFSAYVAVGLWHHYLSTGEAAFLDRMWPVLTAAVDFVLGLRTAGGEVDWARGETGAPAGESLLAGCASIHHSLRCAAAVARRLGRPRPQWESAAVALRHAIVAHPERFADRDRYSMDWYYPVLGGALRGKPAQARLAGAWEAFVVPDWGARCVSDRPWVTVAETCELALSLWSLGQGAPARRLVQQVQRLRCADGSYWTGYVVPDRAVWPEERTSWTAGAVLLADAALRGDPATCAVFGGAELPAAPVPVEECCPADGRCSTRSEPVAASS